MSWHTVRLNDVPSSPWRNGGGLTRELVAWPDSTDWTWRMSVAEVACGGPFSRFEGVQRGFAVLGGAGVRLTIGDQTHELTRTSAPLWFDAAVPVDCQLLDGATQDFNLMLRGDQVAAKMLRISGVENFVLDAPRVVAVYAIDAPATVLLDGCAQALAANSLAWQSLDRRAVVQIQGSDALWMEIAL